MNAPAVLTPQTLKANQIMIQGRIDHVSMFEDKHQHIIVTPSINEYSKPSYYRVDGNSRLGSKGEDVRVICTYNGWPNDYPNKKGDKVKDVRGFFHIAE